VAVIQERGALPARPARRFGTSWVGLLPFFLFSFAFIVMPTAYLVAGSLQKNDKPSLQNYADLSTGIIPLALVTSMSQARKGYLEIFDGRSEKPEPLRWEVSLGCSDAEVAEIRDVVSHGIIAEAVASPQRLTDDRERARRVLELVEAVPALVWGRDELGTGDMWNSNSVVAWLLARSDLGAEAIRPPVRGRAPGWRAGLVTARRSA